MQVRARYGSYWAAICLLGVAALGACEAEPEMQAAVLQVHPIPEAIVSGGVVTTDADLRRPIRGPSSIDSMLVIPVRSDIDTLLSETGPDLFTGINAITELGDGRVMLLDSRTPLVSVVKRGAARTRNVGRGGSGPGEYRGPLTIGTLETGELAVATITHRLELFVASGDSFLPSRSVQTPISVRSMCSIRGVLYVHGASPEDPDKVIHILDPATGAIARSFGGVYHSGRGSIDYQLIQGRIACSSGSSMVAYAPDGVLGEVRGYSTDGIFKWRTSFRDFRPMLVQDTPDGYSAQVPEGGFDRLHTLLPLGDRWLLAQYDYVSMADFKEKNEYTTLYSLVLDAATGAIVDARSDLPPLGAISRKSAIEVHQLPAPFLVRSAR